MSRVALVIFILIVSLVVASAGVNRWTSSGPEGGTIRSFQFHPGNNHILFATSGFEHFRSTDMGGTWKRLSTPIDGQLLVSPKPPARLLLLRYDGVSIYESADNGTSWRKIFDAFAPVTARFDDMQFDPQDQNHLYAIGQRANASTAFFQSTDGGRTWKVLHTVNLGHSIGSVALVIDPLKSSTVFLLLNLSRLYKTTNRGNTWVETDAGIPCCGNIYDIAIDPKQSQVLFAAGGRGIFRSTTGGLSWQQVSPSPVHELSINPSDPSQVLAIGRKSPAPFQGATVETLNGGRTWHSLLLSSRWSYETIAVHPLQPNVIFAGATDRGVFRSLDGGAKFLVQNEGLRALGLNGISANAGIVVGSQSASSFLSTDNAKNWSILASLPSSPIADILIHPAEPNFIIAAGSSPPVSVSTNTGKTWRSSENFPRFSAGTLVLDPTNVNTFYVLSYNQIVKTTNAGRTWSKMTAGIADQSIVSLDVSRSNPSDLYAGTDRGLIFSSRNGGKTWKKVYTNAQACGIAEIAIDPRNPNVLYMIGGVTTSYYGDCQFELFKSNDGGATWKVKNESASRVHINAKNPEELFVVTASSLFVSEDAGATWAQFPSSGLPPETGLYDMAIDSADPKNLHLATTTGIFSYNRK